MSDYYKRVIGDLSPGHIADSKDINLMQTNVADAFKAAISDHHEHTSYILGHDENAFRLTPAPKRLGQYIDTMNLVESGNERWLSIRKTSYRQGIKKSKSSLYSVICKFRNLSSQPITVWCELRKSDNSPLGRTSVTVPARTESAEFEVVFDAQHITTAPGRSHQELEPFDSKYMAPPERKESFEQGIDYAGREDINSFTIGSSEVYFIVESLNLNETDLSINGDEYDIITDESFCILADKSGKYGQLLYEKPGLDYVQTSYDLHFKDVYATTSTYLCEMGEAVIDGEKVKCMDTHISIAGSNDFGDIDTYVFMDIDGALRGINSPAFFKNNKAETNVPLPPAILPIAIITTYMNDERDPYVYQDDSSMIVRPRSHHERIRRLEREMEYVKDIAIPSRLKYTLSGSDLVNNNPAGEVSKIDGGNCYITTNSKGDVVVKSTKAEVITIPIILKDPNAKDTSTEATTTDEKTTEDSTEKEETKKTEEEITKLNEVYEASINEAFAEARNLAELKDMVHDSEKGTLKLKTTQEKTKGTVGLTDEAAKETEFNPWDDDASNRPANKDVKPIEREYVVQKGKNGQNDFDSEFPAMTFYTEKDYNLTGLTIPITKFKNCESIKFIIWKRQGPNNKTNTVWFEKRMYTSESFSLENAKSKDDYQIMEDGFTIKIDGGLSLPKGQYVIVCLHTPKEGSGSCFVETYKPEKPKDFCIRYYGAGDASHFLLKERYHEIWYNSATFTGTEAILAKEGSVTSGTITWENEEPINKIIARANITTPEKCSYELYADTGGGFQKLELGKETNMTGGGISFKWKLVFKGDGDTPTLEYDPDKGYAIEFTLARKAPEIGTYNDNNECITTKTFDGGAILQEYLGDPHFNGTSRFSNYEFARIWSETERDGLNPTDNLLIDIAASDYEATISYQEKENNTMVTKEVTTDVFSFIYADLTLDDFDVDSVDYSHYDSQTEPDEHNLRLKLDTEHSYNDKNINIFSKDPEILPVTGIEVDSSSEYNGLAFTAGSAPTTNDIIIKYKQDNFIDLSKYGGVRLGIIIEGEPTEEDNTFIKGLGLYISSTEEEGPLSLQNDINNIEPIHGIENLPDLNQNKEDIIKQYYGKIMRVEDTINGVTYIGYFRYVKDSDGKYQVQQLHNLKSYNLYKLPDLVYSERASDATIQDKTIFYTEIDIDPDSLNIQQVREIGLVALVDDGYEVINSCTVSIGSIQAMEDDYHAIFDPALGNNFKPFREDLSGTSNHYTTTLQTQTLTTEEKNKGVTAQKRSKINVYYDKIAGDGEILAYYPIEKATTNFKHVGLQIAANCWIPKNALEMHFCSDSKGAESVYSLKIPTLNTIHDPVKSTVTTNKDDGYVFLTEIFKKIKKDITIKSISIRATSRFKTYMKKIRPSTSTSISLYIGKIVLYKAESIPMFHKKMRYKIYNNNVNNILSSGIRKVGCVIEYK